jgi:hypothetical protein
MVSNTKDDFPEPETPVNTVIFRRGMSTEMFLRLFSRAPRTWMARSESDGCMLLLDEDPVYRDEPFRTPRRVLFGK